MAWRAHPLNEPSHLAANPLVLGIPNIDTRRERAYSLVIIRAPVAPEVLDSIPLGANILRFNGVVHSVVGDVPIDSVCS